MRQIDSVVHPDDRFAPSGNEPGTDVYPYVLTTYRIAEHHTAGGMSRWSPYLAELAPDPFCEISPELAAQRGLVHGNWATIVSPRGAIEARVLVTDRIAPLRVQNAVVHQIGLPYHWGPNGLVSGDAAKQHRLGMVAEPYSQGRGGASVNAGKLLSLAGIAGALLGRHNRIASAASGIALLAASATTRWGIFHAGLQSADDPKYTVVPQRERLAQGHPATGTSTTTRTVAAPAGEH